VRIKKQQEVVGLLRCPITSWRHVWHSHKAHVAAQQQELPPIKQAN